MPTKSKVSSIYFNLKIKPKFEETGENFYLKLNVPYQIV